MKANILSIRPNVITDSIMLLPEKRSILYDDFKDIVNGYNPYEPKDDSSYYDTFLIKTTNLSDPILEKAVMVFGPSSGISVIILSSDLRCRPLLLSCIDIAEIHTGCTELVLRKSYNYFFADYFSDYKNFQYSLKDNKTYTSILTETPRLVNHTLLHEFVS